MIIASFPKGSFPANSWPVGTWPVAPAVVDIQYTEVMEFAVCIATSAGFSVVLPNEVDAVTGTMVVSGAGTSAANGTYAYADLAFSKPRYVNGSNQILWFGLGFDVWAIFVAGSSVYESTDNVATPDLVTTWAAVSPGIAPVPTVTSTAPISGVSVTAAFTVEMPMIIDFELYEELSA